METGTAGEEAARAPLATRRSIRRQQLEFLKKRLLTITRLFFKNRMGVVGLVILLFFFQLAIFAPLWAPFNPDPILRPSGDPDKDRLGDILGAPNGTYLFGTDNQRRDVLSRVIYGSRISLVVGFAASAVAMGLGTLVGLVSGFWGGWRDEVIMRITDVFLSIPFLVFAIVVSAILGRINLWQIIIVIGVTFWSSTARLVRAMVLSLKERQFVERSKALGSGDVHIVSRHILPNVVPIIFAEAILTIAVAILTESTLSFLGRGPQDQITWGVLLNNAYDSFALTSDNPWFMFIPGFCLVTVIVGFTFLGYALDDVLNPKLRKR